MLEYGLYVDDSGTKEYADHPSKYGTGNSRYFVFGGILLQRDTAARLSEKLSGRKIATFGTADVEVKSNWLRIHPRDGGGADGSRLDG